MKKILTILMLLVLAACEYRGNINFLPIRNKLFTVWQTEEIFYYEKNSGEEFLAESTTTTEEKFEKGQVLITHRGDQMAFSKTVRTDYYSTETIKPTKSVVLDSAYSPVKIDKDSEFIAFGEITLKGEKYMLVRQGKDNDIILVDGDGNIFDHIGRIVDDRLAVLDITFYAYPQDVKMVPVVNTRVEETPLAEGFALAYNGVNDADEMVFTYTSYGPDGAVDEEIAVSVCEEVINIHGINITVYNADNDKIEYMIM